MMSDLLPPSATAQERAISDGMDRTIPVPVKEMWNPDTCPASMLPWLAWTFSVDTWSSAWTEQQKRAVIKSAVSFHGRKGTIGALKVALAGLGYESGVIEWFEKIPEGDPYTFDVLLTLEQLGMPNEAAYAFAERLIHSAKNLRSHLDTLVVQCVGRASVSIGCTMLVGETITISAEPAA